MKYIGVLGPRRRTERLVSEIAPALELTAAACMARLHTPVGLDLGGHAPAAIALAIVAELQAIFAGREARQLPSLRPVHA
jgi:xanthine dehydrogenase accessory factor